MPDRATLLWWNRSTPEIINPNEVNRWQIDDIRIIIRWSERSVEGGPYPAHLEGTLVGNNIFEGTYSYPGSDSRNQGYAFWMRLQESDGRLVLTGLWRHAADGGEGGMTFILPGRTSDS